MELLKRKWNFHLSLGEEYGTFERKMELSSLLGVYGTFEKKNGAKWIFHLFWGKYITFRLKMELSSPLGEEYGTFGNKWNFHLFWGKYRTFRLKIELSSLFGRKIRDF